MCDRVGDRILRSSTKWVHTRGAFSPDRAQKYAYIADCTNDQIHIPDRATGVTLSSFGRPGQAAGDISSPHTLAVDLEGQYLRRGITK